MSSRDNGKIVRIMQYFFLSSILLAGLCISAGCLDSGGEDGDKIIAAVTLSPMAEFVSEVGGDRVEVIVLLPPGADPHTYEPEFGQIMNISRSDIYFRIGDGFLPIEDRFVERLTDLETGTELVDLSGGIDILDEDSGGGRDPHIWLSLRNAGVMVDTVHEALIDLDPEGEPYYTANRDAYRARLEKLDIQVTEQMAGSEPRVFIVTHPSWGYFARDYALLQVSIETEGKEATAKDLEKIITIARENDVRVVFAEPQFSSRGADIVAREIGGRVEFIDPLSPDYISNMESVAGKIAGSM